MKRILHARDLMNSPVQPLDYHTPIRDAVALLARQGLSGAPVLDEEGQARGVFSFAQLAQVLGVRRGSATEVRTLEGREPIAGIPPPGLDDVGMLPVEDFMSRGIHSVSPEATFGEVLRKLVSSPVRRVFVQELPGASLRGIITPMDVLRVLGATPDPERMLEDPRRHE